MKLCNTVLVSSLAAAATRLQLADAWTISTTPASSLGEHQELAKTWTVSGDATLTTLKLGAIGRVFVDYDASLAAGTVAKIVVSGNSRVLLDIVDVANVDDNESALKLQLNDQDLKDKGYLLTQVYLAAKQSIVALSHAHSGDVVVGSDVLVQSKPSATLNLAVAGSGDLYVGSDSTNFELSSVTADLAGSGNLQLLAETLKLESSLLVGTAGSGDLAVVAENIAAKGAVAVAVAGSGDVVVQTDKLTVPTLSTRVTGSGDVTYSRGGSVTKQSIFIAGSGEVEAGSIVAVDTDVTIVGSGDVLVQTSGKLQVTAQFSGDVRYYGVTPTSITSKGRYGYKHKQVKQAKKNHFHEYEVKPLPARKPVFIAVEVASSTLFSSEPKIKSLIEIDNDRDLPYFSSSDFGFGYTSLAAKTTRHAPGVVVFAAVGLALAAVGVAATKYKARMEREKYAPLV